MTLNISDEQWRKKLTPEQFKVLRDRATEPPFSGELLHNNKKGIYSCAACGQELFSSKTKFDSNDQNAGWPHFYEAIKNDAVNLVEDYSQGMHRTEINCANCGSHLGHLFYAKQDQPTNKQYCVNSMSLKFKPEE